jgi:hypothetical protein
MNAREEKEIIMAEIPGVKAMNVVLVSSAWQGKTNVMMWGWPNLATRR